MEQFWELEVFVYVRAAFVRVSACLSRGGAGETVCELSPRLCTFTDVLQALERCVSSVS